MIGFIIYDSDLLERERVESSIDRMRTYRIFYKCSINSTDIYLTKNNFSNNYFVDGKRFVLCACGTIIFKGKRGNEALGLILKELTCEKTVESFYLNFLGSYNLLIVDKETSNIDIYTDKEGLMNSYVFNKEGKYAISSHQLLLASLLDTPINYEAIGEFVHIGACLNWKTIFSGINKTEGAARYCKSGSQWDVHKLWNIRVGYPLLVDDDSEIVRKTSEMLMNDMDVLSTIKGEDILVDLTGGTDTRTILSCILKFHDNITVSTAGPDKHIDVIISKLIAKKLGLNHFWFRDTNQINFDPEVLDEAIDVSDGIINPFPLVKSLAYFKEKAENYKIILGGNGGPLFKDHYWLFEFNRTNLFREPNWKRISRFSITDYPIQEKIIREDYMENIFDHLEKIFKNHSKRVTGTNNQKLDYVYFDLKCPSFHSPQFTLANQFMDCYHPLMNGHIVEYMINIQPKVRKRNTLQFSIIYNNCKRLAWIKTDNQYPAVPFKGKFFFLRAFVFWRYFRAFLRKFYMLILKSNFTKPVHSVGFFTRILDQTGFLEIMKSGGMKTSHLYDENVLNEMLNHPEESSNLTYLLNILSVELFLKRVDDLRPAGK